MSLPPCRLLAVASLVSFASNWQFGFQITYINTASNTFYQLATVAKQSGCQEGQNCTQLGTTEWANSWGVVVASFYPGTFLGFILVPCLVRRVGVQSALLYSTAPALLGCVIQLIARGFIHLGVFGFATDLVLGRFLVGVHAGCALCLLPLFTIEVSPERHRPFLATLQQVSQALATLLGLLLGSETLIPVTSARFEFLQLCALLPTLLFVALLWHLPPTPFRCVDTLAHAGSEADLVRSVRFYHGNTHHMDAVRTEAFGRWQITNESNWEEVRDPHNWKGLMVGSLAAVSYAFTADDLIDSFSNDILQENGANNSAEAVTVFFGFLLLAASIIGSFLVDHFGRKRLIILGLVGTALSNVMALAGGVAHWVPLQMLGFALTKTAIGLGAGAPAWFLTSELVSPRITHLCQSMSTGVLLIASGIVTLVYLPLCNVIGVYALLVLAILPALSAAILLLLFLPETKDRTNKEIRFLLSAHLYSGLTSSEGESWRRFPSDSDPLHDRRRSEVIGDYGSLKPPTHLRIF